MFLWKHNLKSYVSPFASSGRHSILREKWHGFQYVWSFTLFNSKVFYFDSGIVKHWDERKKKQRQRQMGGIRKGREGRKGRKEEREKERDRERKKRKASSQSQ